MSMKVHRHKRETSRGVLAPEQLEEEGALAVIARRVCGLHNLLTGVGQRLAHCSLERHGLRSPAQLEGLSSGV